MTEAIRVGHRRVLDPTYAFVADSLTSTNTGVPVGTVLTNQAGHELNASYNGGSYTAKRITSHTRFEGIDGFTFTNCEFAFPSYFMVSGNNGANVLFDHCTFNVTVTVGVDCTIFSGSGATFYRCYFIGWDNAVRMGRDCVMDQCFAEQPSNLPDAHVDGVEMYGIPGETAGNNVIRDCRIITGPPYSWSPGGVTAAVNCTSDFGDVTGITIERNYLKGGAFVCYLLPHPSTPNFEPTQIRFSGNRMAGGAFGRVTLDSASRIECWEGNVDLGFDGDEYNAPYIHSALSGEIPCA